MTAPNDAPPAGRAPAARSRTLSKSDFKAARECEAKLYFREHGYPDGRRDDPFLTMLAEGGYMVEALAKARYPDGIALSYGDPASGWEQTRALLERDEVTIFEATLLWGSRLARVDILEKHGGRLRLMEVKAKSFDRVNHEALLDTRGTGEFRTGRSGQGVGAAWRPYLEDVTFQVLALEALFPGLPVDPFLVLVDKSARSRREGAFDLFERLPSDSARRLSAPRFLGSARDLADLPLLAEVSVATEVNLLRGEVAAAAERLEHLLDAPFDAFDAARDHRCKECEFRAGADVPLNGFRECWGELADPAPHVLDLFSIGTVKDPDGLPLARAMYDRRRTSLFDVPEESLSRKDGSVGPVAQRQRRQIDHMRSEKTYIAPGLASRLEALTYPLHFVDFEASRIALPYHAGMRPYGLLAFQWSCHTIAAPGAAPAHSEWLNVEDYWPCARFVESLRSCIGDEGTILTWSHFERSSLENIRGQLDARKQLTPDLDRWFAGLPGRIFDLEKVAREDYYHPLMRGKTSIKVVLDALWQSDAVLRAECAAWLSVALDAPADPYKALPPVVIGGVEQAVAEGTGAIRAYEALMFTDVDAVTKAAWSQLLRQYCELDTLSMVLIFNSWVRQAGKR